MQPSEHTSITIQWYAYPFISEHQGRQGSSSSSSSSSTHFKSTDGHVNIYNFSLRRLNLDFLATVSNASLNNGAVLLVDASKYKVQPDSFSATLPIWCAVLNHLATIYRRRIVHGDDDGPDSTNVNNDSTSSVKGSRGKSSGSLDDDDMDNHDDDDYYWWDTSLFTPPCISQSEHDEMKRIIPDRVKSVMESGVILDPNTFLDMMKKPLRCFWIENDATCKRSDLEQLCNDVRNAQTQYMCIICISCSDPERSRKEDAYISGAGDDEESWANGLTPSLLWDHHDEIFSKVDDDYNDCDSNSVRDAISALVKNAKFGNEEWFRARTSVTAQGGDNIGSGKIRPCFTSYFDTIGSTGISIGTRRSGRPPDCWDHFDAIVNVTTMEYPEMTSSYTEGTGNGIPDGKYYLQLPVKEGKRDRSELENWMAIAMLFVGVHAASNQRRVLIHCAQGMDRSVAIAMAAICIYFPQVLSAKLSQMEDLSSTSDTDPWTANIGYASLDEFRSQHNQELSMGLTSKDGTYYRSSGIPQRLIEPCMGRDGRDMLFSYIDHLQQQKSGDSAGTKVFATKETLRLALVFIHQFRPKACPTRSTMQKLNRFFMSKLYEPP